MVMMNSTYSELTGAIHNEEPAEIMNVLLQVKDMFSHIDLRVKEKATADFVTNKDLEIEKFLIQELQKIDDIPCLSEETESHSIDDRYWLIDPIDGTTNFIHRYPSYCTAVAKIEDGETVYGFVLDAVASVIYVGLKDHGSFKWNLITHEVTEMRVSRTEHLTDSLIGFGCPYNKTKSERLFSILNAVFKKCHDLKRKGPASLDLCYVADGALDAYFEFDLKEWDYKAGALILREAGGVITDWDGKSDLQGKSNILATNGVLADELLQYLT